ncbi:MAG: hypothetical protein ABII07_03005 [Patescibacteria group bacterium]|nr:hypothetical protein [Patescibacteria group bacterium]
MNTPNRLEEKMERGVKWATIQAMISSPEQIVDIIRAAAGSHGKIGDTLYTYIERFLQSKPSGKPASEQDVQLIIEHAERALKIQVRNQQEREILMNYLLERILERPSDQGGTGLTEVARKVTSRTRAAADRVFSGEERPTRKR